MKDRSYLIIGGDKRQDYLLNIFKSKGKRVSRIFYDNADDISKTVKKISEANVVILPFPTTKDKINLYAPFLNQTIPLSIIIENISKDSIIFMGGECELLKQAKTKNVINLLANETFALKNAMATAEATLPFIIQNTTKTIFKSEILITGYGRISKILADYLLGLKAKVTVCARSEIATTKAVLSGANAIDFNSLKATLHKYEVIINTIPSLIFKKDELEFLDKSILLIDLASNPGGFDFDFADKNGIKIIRALSLPGKYSPQSAAEFICEIISKTLLESFD